MNASVCWRVRGRCLEGAGDLSGKPLRNAQGAELVLDELAAVLGEPHATGHSVLSLRSYPLIVRRAGPFALRGTIGTTAIALRTATTPFSI